MPNKPQQLQPTAPGTAKSCAFVCPCARRMCHQGRRSPLFKKLLLLASLLSSFAQAGECTRFEYSNLSIDQILLLKDNVVVGQQLYVSWDAGNAIATWKDNDHIAGSIKKPLKEFFNVKNIDEIDILNSLGKDRWEAFSHQQLPVQKYETKNIWYLKRCLEEMGADLFSR